MVYNLSGIDKGSHKIKVWYSLLFILFVGTFFVDGITRYKHLISISAVVTAIVIVYKNRWVAKEIVKDNIFKMLIVFIITSLYACLISIDKSLSFKYFSNSILEKTVVTPIIFAIVISQLSKKEISTSLLYGLCLMFVLSGGKELYAYYLDYKVGIYPFSNYNHRFIAEALLFSLPFLLFLWKKKCVKAKIAFVVMGIIYTFLMLGLLQRGAWLAILVLAVLWCIFYREWKLPLITALVLVVVGVGVATHYHDRLEMLTYKLGQTSSSHRFGNGTQGAAFEMIKQHPFMGTGIGDKVYLKAYANNSDAHQEWFFREPIGPHNFFLANWFAGGIIGLLSAVSLVIVLLTVAYKGFKTSENEIKYCYSTLFLFIFSDFLVRGWVEETFIYQTAIASAVLMAMSLSSKRHNIRTTDSHH